MDAACSAQLEAALRQRDAPSFVAACRSSLRSNKSAFPVLRQHIRALLGQASHEALGKFALCCVEEALSDPDATAISHLVLDTIAEFDDWQPPRHLVDGQAGSQAHAAAVLLRCCGEQPRLAPKVAHAFHLTTEAVPVAQQAALLDAISALLDSSASSAVGVALLLHFPPLRRHFHLEAILEDLVLSSQDPVAIRMVEELGSRELQELYVSYCLQYAQLRSANTAVKRFGLQQAFPDVERLHKTKQLGKMVEKGLWGVAAQYVGEDDELQRSLLHSMLAAGELSLAAQQRRLFGLDSDPEFDISPERLAVEQQRRREQYLQMPLPPEAVHYVQCSRGLAAMGAVLGALLLPPARHGAAHTSLEGGTAGAGAAGGASGAAAAGAGGQEGVAAAATAATAEGSYEEAELLPAIGIDLEWQPDSDNSSPPSLLQISTDHDVFLVDLLALTGQEAELSASLAPVLASDRVFKLGCGVASDCRKLAGHHPRAFRLVRSCLDLSTAWRAHTVDQTGKRSTAGYKKRAGEISLSVLAQQILGKPLDKACQVSDWGRRPLSEQQLAYAALDAHAAVLVFRGMGQLYRPYRTRQGLLHHAFTYEYQGKAGGGGDGGNGSNGHGGHHPHGGSGAAGGSGGHSGGHSGGNGGHQGGGTCGGGGPGGSEPHSGGGSSGKGSGRGSNGTHGAAGSRRVAAFAPAPCAGGTCGALPRYSFAGVGFASQAGSRLASRRQLGHRPSGCAVPVRSRQHLQALHLAAAAAAALVPPTLHTPRLLRLLPCMAHTCLYLPVRPAVMCLV